MLMPLTSIILEMPPLIARLRFIYFNTLLHTIKSQGTQLWNSIPTEIRMSDNVRASTI